MCHLHSEKCFQRALPIQGYVKTRALYPHATEAEPRLQAKQILQQLQKHHYQQLQFSQPYREWVMLVHKISNPVLISFLAAPL